MGIVREISPELDPVEFPDNMDEAAVDAFMAQRGRELRQGLIDRRQAQLAAETEGDEALAYREGKVSPWEFAGSVARELPQKVMRGTGQFLRGAGEYLATAPIPRERGEIAPEIVRENIRRSQRTPKEIDQEVEASMTRQLGAEMVAAAPERFPTLPGVRDTLASQVSGGIGSVVSLLPAGLTGPAAPFVGGAMYGLSAGEDFADDAEQVINSRIAEALTQGNTEVAADLERRKFDMKNTARMAGRAIGAGTEGVLGLAGKIRVGKSQIGGIGARLAERMVPKTAPVAVQNAVRGAVEGGLTEAAQEGTEQILGNAAALAVYDPNRGIMDDVAQSVLVGGLTGKVVGGAFGSRGQNRDPLPASRAAVAGEVVPGTEIPQDIGAPDLTLEDLGDLLPVEEVVAPVPEPPVPQAQTEGLAQIDRSGTPVPATQKTPENMGISQVTPVPEAAPEPAPEAPAVDSPTLSPATAAETPTAPETPVSPAPSSSVEGVTGEKPKRTRKVKRVAIDDLAGVEAVVAPEPIAPAPTPSIPPDDTAMEAATAAAMAPGAPAPVTTAQAERAAVDEEMTRATTRVPEVAPAQVGMPDEGIAGKPEPTIPSLPTELAEAIAAEEAPDVFVENTVRKFGESERASAQSTKPNERQRQVIEQGKRIATEKGWDWNKVKETARRQLGLNENFLKPDSRADQVFKMMREEDAAAAKRNKRTAEEMARIDAETKARRDKEAADKAEKEATQRRQAEEKAAETERQTAQEHDQIVAKLPKKWMASWKKAKTKKAKAKLLNEAMVASGTRNEAALTAALDRAQEPTITEAPAAKNDTQQNDSNYVEAVLRGDIKTAQQMVDAAARKAWPNNRLVDSKGNPIRLYHGTAKGNKFTVFKPSGTGLLGAGIYLSEDRNYASEAGPEIMEVYANISSPKDGETGSPAGGGPLAEVAIRKPQNIKSADPVVYDDGGKIVPLSKRFDLSSTDIRGNVASLQSPIAPAAEPPAAQAAEVATPEVVKQSKPPMAPKAQKAYLLEKIDEAIATAPEGVAEKENKSDEEAWKKGGKKGSPADFALARNKARFGTVTIEVPGNGTFEILNTQQSLKAFKEKAKSFPTDTAGPTRSPLPAKGQSKPAAIGKNTKESFLATAKDFVSDDPDRKVLQYIMSDGNRSAATDGRSMLVWDEPVGGKKGEQKLFGLDGKEAKADQSLNIPNWNSVIPKSPEVVFKKLNTERLFGIVKQAIAGPKEIDVGKRRTEEVRRNVHILSNPDGSIGVFSESQFGDYVHNVQKGAKNISKVDGERLLDIVQAARRFGSESVSMAIDAQDPKTPLVFKWDGAQAILMPLGNIEPGSTLQSLTTGEKQPDILERALNAGEVRMAQPTETDPSSKPLSDELISTFTETDEYDFVELKPNLLLEQISSGKLKLKPVRAALLSHLLRPDTRHKLRQIELVKSKEFSGRFNTRGNSNVGSIQISTIYKDGTPVSVNHFAHALTHELVHNAVTSKLDESPEFKQRAKSLYDYVKEKTPGTKWADSYAMSNLSEFFAEGMANSGFRKFLLGIEYPVTMRTPGMPSTGRLSAFGGMLYLLKQALNLPKFIYDKFTGQQVEAITALDELIDVAQRLESRQRVGSQAMMGFMEASNPPAIERALNAAIKATDRTSATFSDPFLIAAVGLPVLNAALRIVRRVYLKTRDLARAKRQGMRLIRRQLRTDPKADLPRIEEAFNQLVEGTAEKPGPDQIEAFQAADGTRRQKSRGLFTGDVTVDTDAEWQAGAERWIAQFNGNIRRAFEAARSTDYATTGLNPAAQDYVFGRLLELTEIQANAARNDVDALRALNLQKEIADAMRLASSEAGKALGARALVQNRLLWMFPVLNYRNLIREAQKRLPFPDVVADEVRTWLQESGRRAVQEMRNAMTDADKVFARELKTTVRDMRVVWRDVMTASVESQEAMRRKILEELVKAPELKGLSRQGYIDIANLLGKAWERERARIFAAEFRKQVPLPTVKEDVRRKLFTAIPDILKWANLGLLDNEAFRNAVAPKFGVAKFDGETAKKLNEMAQRAQKVDGSNRKRIIDEMYNLMQVEGGVRWPDIVRDYWYAAVLGAVNTQVDNGLGVINGALNTVMGMAMSDAEVRKAMGKSYVKGFSEGIADFFPILWNGEVWRSVNFNPDQPANTLNALSKSGNLFARGLSKWKYVSRLMTALDHINALSTDQAMKAWALGRRYPIEHLRRYMMPSENVLRTARLKAEAEGTPPNLMRKRVREIVQESIPVEVLISSKDIRELVTFTNQPKGLMGALYRGVQEMEKKAPGFKVLSGTNFLRFAANYSNEILNYVAPVALYRYYVSAPSRADGRLGLKMGQEERQLILAKLAVGTALGTFAAALFLGDDDDEKDRKIDITGSFKSLDPNKRKQLLSEGRAPYSIRIGDKYVSYRQLPFGGVLGAIGELRDRQLYNPQEWDQESIARKFVDGAFAGSLIVRDSPAISSFTEFLGTANAYKYDMNEQVEKSLPKYIARLGGSFIPRIAKEIDAWADPAIYKANTGHEFFLQQMPIFRRELGEGPVLNVLGEPVQVERYPWSRWIKTRKEDKAWSTLGELASKGVFLPVPSVTVKVMENGKRREMTPAESYRYQQRVGQAYRKFVEDNSERLLQMKPDKATDFIDTQTERIRSRIRAGGA